MLWAWYNLREARHPQDTIPKRSGLARTSFQYHLPKMATLPFSANGVFMFMLQSDQVILSNMKSLYYSLRIF
jgi:hypothetical protein